MERFRQVFKQPSAIAPVLNDAGASSSLLFPSGHGRRGRSAGRRNVFDSRLLRRRASNVRLAPAGAPSAAISVSEPRFLGRGLAGVTRGCGSPCPSPAKAPRRRVLVPAGRGPGASRERACEARPRAPHQPRAFALWPPETGAGVGAQSLRSVPLSRTPHEAPFDGPDALDIVLVGIYVNRLFCCCRPRQRVRAKRGPMTGSGGDPYAALSR